MTEEKDQGKNNDIVRMQEQIVTLFKNDERIEKCVGAITDDIKEIKEQFANRLPLWATILISVLVGFIGYLIGG